MPPIHKTACSLCESKVFYIPRHIRQVHNWLNTESKFALNILKLRRKHSNWTHKKDYMYYKKCPIDDCPAVTKRVAQHIHQVHKIKK